MITPRHHLHPKQDERIRQDILRQLMWQTDIQSREIEVEVKGARATLSGCVETRLEKMEAENAAKAVFGVSNVCNEIRIEPKRPRTDDEIRQEITAGLRMMTSVLEEVPAVSVSDGIVTLRGAVRWNFQRASAEKVADAVVGTCQVRNLIEVTPKIVVKSEACAEVQPEASRTKPPAASVPGAMLLLDRLHRQSRAM